MSQLPVVNAYYDGEALVPDQPLPLIVGQKVRVIIEPQEESQEEATTPAQPTAPQPSKSLIGLLKGKVWMSDDFDEPLEEFKDYM